MGTITGGVAHDTYYNRDVSWRPVGPVVDEYAFYTANSKDGYICLGVVGNASHWNHKNAGDHTSRSSHSTVIGGKTVYPKPGWVYAIDGRVPEPEKFERWFVKQLRAGKYRNVKYWNILHRHWNQKLGWAKATYSSDDHLHISFDPGSEYDDSSILADYEAYRTGKPTAPKPAPAPAPAPKPTGKPAPGPELAWPLPAGYYFGPEDGPKQSVSGHHARLFRGRTDRYWLQQFANQLAKRGWSCGKGKKWLSRYGNDGKWGDEYDALVRAFQSDQGLRVDGKLGPATWRAAYRNRVR